MVGWRGLAGLAVAGTLRCAVGPDHVLGARAGGRACCHQEGRQELVAQPRARVPVKAGCDVGETCVPGLASIGQLWPAS